MNKIIVPTDFSAASNQAVKYAVNLAFFFQCEVELVHVLNPATDLNNGYKIDPGIETIKRQKLKALAEDAAKQHLPSEVKVMSTFILGFPIEEIIKLSKGGISLIVVGATGETGVLDRVFGSVPSNLVRKAHSPVLIVPKGASFQVFKNLAYASADANLDQEVAHMIKDFVLTFKATMHCVHIGKESDYPTWQMKAIFGDTAGFHDIIMKHLDQVDVVSALNTYCGENDIDLLMMTTRHRNFWDSIIHTSMTREMALDPKLPLFVFHHQDRLLEKT